METPIQSEVPSPSQGPRLLPLAGILNEFYADEAAAYEATQSGVPRGPVTGLPSLDREIGSALSVGLHALIGRPGSGKTALALQIAEDCRHPCLFVTCEIGPVEMLRRMAARATDTFVHRFNGGMPPEEALDKARAAAAVYRHVAILDATTGGHVSAASGNGATALNIEDALESIRGDSRHVLCVLDSLQTWSARLDGDEYTRLGYAVAALRDLSHRASASVLYTAEMNRSSSNRAGTSASGVTDKKGRLDEDFLGSGAGHRSIEYQSETVLGLFKDSDQQQDKTYNARLTIEKNRHGAVKTGFSGIPLVFDGYLQSFSERVNG